MRDVYYNFWNEKFFPGFRKALLEIEKRSLIKFNSKSHTQKEKIQYKKMLYQSLDNIEKYYYGLLSQGYINNHNFDSCLKQIKSLDSIDFMDKKDWDKYDAYTLGNEIYLCPEFNDMPLLDHKSSFFRITSHELTHHMNSMWKKDRDVFAEKYYQKYKKALNAYGINSLRYIVMGFELLGEVISEDISETITYKDACVSRPNFSLMKNKKMYGRIKTFKSNFYVYQELQEIASDFACCLDFIKDSGNINTNIKKISYASLSKDFVYKIAMCDSEDLIVMLGCMGKIKEASYTASGLTDLVNCDVRRYLNTFNTLARYNHKSNESVQVKRYS